MKVLRMQQCKCSCYQTHPEQTLSAGCDDFSLLHLSKTMWPIFLLLVNPNLGQANPGVLLPASFAGVTKPRILRSALDIREFGPPFPCDLPRWGEGGAVPGGIRHVLPSPNSTFAPSKNNGVPTRLSGTTHIPRQCALCYDNVVVPWGERRTSAPSFNMMPTIPSLTLHYPGKCL